MMADPKPIEVRRDPPTRREPDGAIDEICGSGRFHLERMSDDTIALLLDGDAGDTLCVLLEPKRRPRRGSAPHVRARILWVEDAEMRAV
jgi:hypothetical protein